MQPLSKSLLVAVLTRYIIFDTKIQTTTMDLDVDMSTEVFETPDPEVTFQAYAPVGGGGRATRSASAAPEDAHFFDKVRVQVFGKDEGSARCSLTGRTVRTRPEPLGAERRGRCAGQGVRGLHGQSLQLRRCWGRRP